MLEIGAVVAAGRQQHDHRVLSARRRHRAQILQQLLGVIADRRDALPGEGVGKQPHHDLAVLEHVGNARGRAHIVLEHEEIALAGADQVDAGDMRVDVLRRLDAQHLRAEGRIEQHEFRRHQPRLDDLLVVIDVVEEDVDRLHPLDAAPLDQVPFGAVEDARDQIEGDQPLGRAAFGIDGEGDAEPAEQLLSRVLLGDEGVDREIVEQAGERGIGVPDRAVGLAHLIEEFAGKQGRLLRLHLDTHPLSNLRQSRPSQLSKKTSHSKARRASSVIFSGILIRCLRFEQRPWSGALVVLNGERC